MHTGPGTCCAVDAGKPRYRVRKCLWAGNEIQLALKPGCRGNGRIWWLNPKFHNRGLQGRRRMTMIKGKFVTEARQSHGDREPNKSKRKWTDYLFPRETQAPSADLGSGLHHAIPERRN